MIGRIIIVLLLLSITITTFAQDAIKMRAYQTTSIIKGGDSDTATWKRTDVLVVINYEVNKIKIYSKSGQDFDLVKMKKEQQTQDYYVVKYDAVDKKGIECEITLMINENTETIHIGTLFIKYQEGTILLRLKKT